MKIVFTCRVITEYDTDTNLFSEKYARYENSLPLINQEKNKPLSVYFGIRKEADGYVFTESCNEFRRIVKTDHNWNELYAIDLTDNCDMLHQLVINDNKIYIADSHNDKIEIIDILTKQKKSLILPIETDRHYPNSIYFKDNLIYIMCHKMYKGESKVLVYNKQLELVNEIKDVGLRCHSIFELNNELWCCNSSPGLISKLDKSVEIFIGGFTRGVAVTDNHIVVGSSVNYKRMDGKFPPSPSDIPNSRITFVNKKTFKIDDVIEIPDSPVIMEIMEL